MANYKQIYAIEKSNKERILKVCPQASERSGIYILTREENGFKYAYIGQAVRLLSRLAGHLKGYQHIDLSLKKHKFYSDDNPCGWKINIIECPINRLDELERKYIHLYANGGYQLRNKTAGGQNEGKFEIAETKAKKGYRDGLEQGYKNAQQFVKNLFEKHLDYSQKSPKPNKNQEKAAQKFKDFLEKY